MMMMIMCCDSGNFIGQPPFRAGKSGKSFMLFQVSNLIRPAAREDLIDKFLASWLRAS